ncbi:MAG: hypothetical protein K8S87_07375 [Planctomycetes bacterium]|nr:hypothetical protein [Planctomycetota bacterium]
MSLRATIGSEAISGNPLRSASTQSIFIHLKWLFVGKSGNSSLSLTELIQTIAKSTLIQKPSMNAEIASLHSQ